MPVENEVKHELYETGKLNALLQIIKIAFDKGEKQDYEILIDNFKIVPRTSDPELFNNFSEFINADSKVLMVIMFRGNSKQQDKYFFHLNGMPQKEKPLLGIPEGINAEEWEKKQKEKWQKEIRYDELEQENEELLAEIEEKEGIIADLNVKLQQAKDGKLLSLQQMGGALLSGAVSHPFVKKIFPGFDGFGGAPENSGSQNTEEEATFKSKGATETKDENEHVAVALTPQEQGYLLLIRDLEKSLTKPQLREVMYILGQITDCPAVIGSTLKHLSNFFRSKPVTTEEEQEDDKV